MRTFKIIFVTTMITLVIGIGCVVGFLFNSGIVTMNERVEEHTKVVMIDGVVTESTNWKDTTGITFRIDVVDEATIGR